MAYAEKYRITYRDSEELQYYVSILEDGFVGDVTALKGTGAPVISKTVDTTENAYIPIQKSSLDISIVSEDNFSLLEIFMTGALTDVQYKVEHYINGRLSWVGFLDTESCNEEIVDDPRIVELRAVDSLGFLENETFLDHDGEFQYGKYTLLQCIEWCLGKTQLELTLHVGVNIYEETMDDRDDDPAAEPFSQCKVHTRSIKNKTCYEVMTAICEAFGASLYQFDGKWFIDRKHDRWNDRYHAATVLTYPYTSATPDVVNYTYSAVDFTPINLSHRRYFLPPYKSCKTIYNYVVPEDIPRNSNFQEGDFIALISDADNSAYTIDHWDYVKNVPEVSTSSTPFRNDEFDPVSDKLIESTIRLPRDGSGTPGGNNRLRSEAIEVNQGDRVNMSAETRAKFSYDSSSQFVGAFYIRLVGISSTVYTLQERGDDQPAMWQTGTGATLGYTWPPDSDATTWQSVSVRSDPFPEEGDLYVYLLTWDGFVTANETWFKHVKVSFELFLGASTLLKGEKALITQDSTFRGEGDFKITLGDSPKKIISGALFRTTDDTELTTLWFQQGRDELGKRLLVLANRAHFQLQCRFKTKIEGQIKGINYVNPDGGMALLAPITEMVYSASTMNGTTYTPLMLTLDSCGDVADVVLMEFYNEDEEDNPLGDSETLTYLYE